MSEHDKTHKLTLGKHSEKVTAAELEAIKQATGTRFADYEVAELHVAKPVDVQQPALPAVASTKTKAADKSAE